MTQALSTFFGTCKAYAHDLYAKGRDFSTSDAYAKAQDLYTKGCKKAKEYFYAKEPNKNANYTWYIGREKVVLDGDAKKLAIQHTALKNREEQLHRINNAASTALAFVLYHKGIWDHSFFGTLIALPTAYLVNKGVNIAIGKLLHPKMEQLQAQIASIVRHPGNTKA